MDATNSIAQSIWSMAGQAQDCLSKLSASYRKFLVDQEVEKFKVRGASDLSTAVRSYHYLHEEEGTTLSPKQKSAHTSAVILAFTRITQKFK